MRYFKDLTFCRQIIACLVTALLLLICACLLDLNSRSYWLQDEAKIFSFLPFAPNGLKQG